MSSSIQKPPWILQLGSRPQARLRLFCFPFAGGGSLVFRGWNQLLPPEVEVCPVLLPGREQRFFEPPFTCLTSLVETLAQVLSSDRPFVFFGHSMGAMVSFELARQLRREGRPLPSHLLLSGHRAPHLPATGRLLYRLPEAEFLEELRRLNGTPQAILNNLELMQVLTPTLRADFELVDTHRYQADLPLACPISVFGGLSDPRACEDRLTPWREHTQGRFSLQMFPGDHFFLQSAREPLLQAITAHLQPLL
ncbi:thioesterase II family protein [Anthocerotibacter panamensis]|uniref:thioesterase II family protein n=1 Tax=Anthocerotibacter panamensis TaxID=2857077 RepID=UPI001C40463A|nr:alpha/beta fold hydrolase [Anthocerotibacter panamensis]